MQMLAADIMHFLPAPSRPCLTALAFACNPSDPHSAVPSHAGTRGASRYPQGVALRLLQCVCSKQANLAPEDFLSFVLTVLVGGDTIPSAGTTQYMQTTTLHPDPLLLSYLHGAHPPPPPPLSPFASSCSFALIRSYLSCGHILDEAVLS